MRGRAQSRTQKGDGTLREGRDVAFITFAKENEAQYIEVVVVASKQQKRQRERESFWIEHDDDGE